MHTCGGGRGCVYRGNPLPPAIPFALAGASMPVAARPPPLRCSLSWAWKAGIRRPGGRGCILRLPWLSSDLPHSSAWQSVRPRAALCRAAVSAGILKYMQSRWSGNSWRRSASTLGTPYKRLTKKAPSTSHLHLRHHLNPLLKQCFLSVSLPAMGLSQNLVPFSNTPGKQH